MIENRGYVIVTDYVKANTGEDVSDALQQIILDNPNRTIFFPDGEYVIAKPICTPANPRNSVMLLLSNFAVIKAADGWSDTEAMIRLGGIDPYNSIDINGSNYGIEGGIIDGNMVASGISIDSGRETRVEKVSIKHTFIGINIKWGANNRSSDADILDVNIVGNDKIGSIGVLIDGCDNTLTNMRIASVQIGIKNLASSQFLKNIHPLYIFRGELASEEAYRNSCAFWDDAPHQIWYNNCYSDQFCTGFRMRDGARYTYADCFCFWYTNKGVIENGFFAEGRFNSILRSCNVQPRGEGVESAYLKVLAEGGYGRIESPITGDARVTDKTYRKYVIGDVIDVV